MLRQSNHSILLLRLAVREFSPVCKISCTMFPGDCILVIILLILSADHKIDDSQSNKLVKQLEDYKKDLDEIAKPVVTKKPSEVDGLFDIEIKRLED